MYWRLLTTNPTAARDVVLSDKPVISTETDRMDRGMLDQLLLHTGTLGSIYHKNPETFIRTAKPRYLPDSPALNLASKRHLITSFGGPSARPRAPRSSDVAPQPTGAPASAPEQPTIPARPAMNGAGSGAENGAAQQQQVSNDPYSQLAEIDLLGGGGYQTDVPQPRGNPGQQQGDLLF